MVDPSELLAAAEQAIARKSFGDFCSYIDPFYKSGRHIKIMVANLEALFHNEIQKLAIFMPPRHSKPVSVDAMVLLGDGSYKRLGEIAVGDSVITQSGSAQKVEAVHEQPHQTGVRITTASGRSVEAANDHPFLTPGGWVPAGDLSVAMCLIRIGNISDFIVSINAVFNIDCRCLTIKNDHTFTANDFIVHNSLHASERFPAWWLGNRPSDQIIIASFTADVATKSARKARGILAAPSWPFPGVTLDKSSKAAREWRTNKGGVLKAAGIQGTVTSYGANCLIVDDPFSGRAEADSQTYRDAAWDFYIETARTRLQPLGKELLMQTRWHADDLAGRILNSPGSEQWTVLEMPALAMCPTCNSINPCVHQLRDSIGRLPGEELWPEFGLTIPRPGIDPIGNRAFWAVYQQKPRTDAGNLFKREWMQRRYSSVEALPPMNRVVFFVDGAWEEGIANDRSAIGCWGSNGIDYYLIDAWAGRVAYPDLKAKFRDYYMKWREKYPSLVPLVEKAASGIPLIQEMSRETGIPIIGVTVHKKKFARAEAIIHVFESGKVVLPKDAPWLDEWIEEHLGFPAMTHDDYVDTTSGALRRLLDMVGGAVFDESFDTDIHVMAKLPDKLPRFEYDPRRPLFLAVEFTPGKFTALVAQWRAQEAYREGVIIESDQPRDRWRYPVPNWQQRVIYIFDEVILEKADADPSEFAARFIERFGLQAKHQGVFLFGGPSGNSRVQLDSSTNWAIFSRELTQARISWQAEIETIDPGLEQRVNALKAQLSGVDGYGLAVDAERCHNFMLDMNELQWATNGRDFDTKKEAKLGSAAQAASHLAHRLRLIAQTREASPRKLNSGRDFFAR